MQRIRPDIPVIITSGYSKESTLQDMDGVAGFLKNPYAPKALRRTFESVVELRRARG